MSQANKLCRTYALLLDALNRHRGKGQQKVTVEHVHVNAGGQAIVGVVHSPKVNSKRHVGVAFRLYHQPTPDDEQNGGEDQSQDPIRDTDCQPATDNDTGYGTRQQRAKNAGIDRAEDPMADTRDQGQ